MEIQGAIKGYNYDIGGLFYIEVFTDGRVCALSSDRASIDKKSDTSVYGAYFRAINKESTIYFSSLRTMGQTTITRVDYLNDFADSFGIPRASDHVHEIHAQYNEHDDGKDVYAKIDIEFICGCTLSSSNKRNIVNYLKDKYGWEVVLSSIGFEPLSKRTIRVKRKSLSKTNLPF